jgi:hypothetical protein
LTEPTPPAVCEGEKAKLRKQADAEIAEANRRIRSIETENERLRLDNDRMRRDYETQRPQKAATAGGRSDGALKRQIRSQQVQSAPLLPGPPAGKDPPFDAARYFEELRQIGR